MLQRSEIQTLGKILPPLRWIDLAEDMEGATPGVSFRTEDRKWRIVANKASLPEAERTWFLLDMRGQGLPWGPLPTSIQNPITLDWGYPTLEKAKVSATLVARVWPIRAALVGRVIARGLVIQAKLALVTRLVKIQARWS